MRALPVPGLRSRRRSPGPGILPSLRERARERGVPVSVLVAEREQEAFGLLAAACHERLVQSAHDLAAYQAEVDAGRLPAMTTRSTP